MSVSSENVNKNEESNEGSLINENTRSKGFQLPLINVSQLRKQKSYDEEVAWDNKNQSKTLVFLYNFYSL